MNTSGKIIFAAKSVGMKMGCLWTLYFLFFNTSVGQNKTPDAFIRFDEIYSQKLDPEYDEYNFWNGHWDVDWMVWKELDKYAPNGSSLHRVFSALDGKALIELAYNDTIVQGSKTAGISIRYYDSNLENWVMIQSWPGRNAPNISSLKGTHSNGRIQLYQKGKVSVANQYSPVGTVYDNRYTFSDASDDSYRWDSAFSVDSMRTWFTKYMVEARRINDFTSLREADQPYWFTQGDGYNCDDSVLVDLQPFLGQWEGETTYFDEDKINRVTSTRVLLPILSNCAAFGYQISDTMEGSQKELLFATYIPWKSEWLFYTLNNAKGESQTLYRTKSLKAEVVFDKGALFGVPSANPVETMTWKKSKGKIELNGLDKNGKKIYKRVMKKLD